MEREQQACWSAARLLGNAATMGREEGGRGATGGGAAAAPAVGRLGRASAPLFGWFGSAAPEEIRNVQARWMGKIPLRRTGTVPDGLRGAAAMPDVGFGNKKDGQTLKLLDLDLVWDQTSHPQTASGNMAGMDVPEEGRAATRRLVGGVTWTEELLWGRSQNGGQSGSR